ncbi:MAG: transketolase family protein, partial [Atopobium sp.]|nr:transketolase family protein [Atopobium sp.]
AENVPVPVKVIGVQDTYGESGPALQVLAKYGLDTPSILASVKDFLK